MSERRQNLPAFFFPEVEGNWSEAGARQNIFGERWLLSNVTVGRGIG